MSRNVDRIIGVLATLSAGVAVLLLRRWVVQSLKRLKQQRRAGLNDPEDNPQDADEAFRQRFIRPEGVWHSAGCHCGRTRMRIRAGKSIKAVDVPSKLRFPRLTVKPSDVDLLSEQRLLSAYSVRHGQEVGAHLFCSFCGMQIFVVPSEEPTHVLVNADCIDKGTVESMHVTFFSAPESVPCIDAVEHCGIFGEERQRPKPQQLVIPAPAVPSPVAARKGQSVVQDNTDTAPTTPTRAATSSSSDLAPMLSIWAQLPKEELMGSFSSTSSASSKVEPPPEDVKRRSGVDTPMHNKLKQHLQQYLQPEDKQVADH